jgi:uncharacterized protein (TIGR02145 family)
MQLKITVPAQAELGEFGTIKLNYKVNDYLLSLNDIQTAMNDETADSLIKMQQLTSDICQTATYVDNDPLENTITLTDIRDSNTYLVRKLMDDKCWMVQNLRISDVNISAENTDINTDTYNPMTHIPAIDNSTSFTDSYAHFPMVADPSSQAYCLSLKGTSEDCGLLYNWTAAIASTNSTAINVEGTVAPNSICPKNWHLPTGTIDETYTGDFYELAEAFGSIGNASSFINVDLFAGVFSGARYETNWYDQGEQAHYWSSTVDSTMNALYLHFENTGYLLPGTGIINREEGYSVRCVL